MSLLFKSAEAACRKPILEQLGLIQEGADLSWIYSRGTPAIEQNLTASIVGGAGQVFTLTTTPGTGTGTVALYWNGQRIHEDVGYTRSGVTITMAAGYEPAVGDTLYAYIWGNI